MSRGTRDRARLGVAPVMLGRTGYEISPVGFGGYRVDEDHPEHREALVTALMSGCNLVDTSTNYTDGSSERVIGEVLTDLVAAGNLRREDVVLVTKVGYVQGANLSLARERAESGRGFPEMVEYAESCWHCIHPEFVEDQITRSLERLQTGTIDVLLLHNPEYFLKAGGHHGEYYQRIERAFAHLESEVSRGRIRWYGISSNTFPEDRESPEFTSLDACLEAAGRVRPDHHFAVIQFPMNFFEPGAALENNNGGKTILELARTRGLGTLVNRPLNAFIGNRLARLADFPGARDPDAAVERLQAAFEKAMEWERQSEGRVSDAAMRGLTWGHVLHRNFQRISNLENWKSILEYQIRPAMREALPDARRENAEWADEYRHRSDELFDALSGAYAAQAGEFSRHLGSVLEEAVPALRATSTLSRKAIRVYRSIPGVHCILVGMRRPEYVRDALALDPVLSAEEAMDALDAIQQDLEKSTKS